MSNYELLKTNFTSILWILIWLSIGINPEYIFEFSYSYQNLFNFDFIKLLRIIIPLILSVIWLIFILKNRIVFLNVFRNNLSSILINLYFLSQFLSLLIFNNNYQNIYWIFFPFVMLAMVNFIIYNCDEKYYLRLIYISIILLFIVFVKFSYPLFTNFYKFNLSFYNMWPIVYEFDFTAPRPTGLSRTALILIIFLLSFKFENTFYKLVRKPLIIFFGLTICLLQSRTIVFLWPMIIFLNIFLKKENFKIKLKEIMLFLLLPIILFYLFNSSKAFYKNFIGYKEYILEHSEKENKRFDLDIFKKSLENNENTDLYKIQIYRETDPKSFSSFRTLHWKNIYVKVKENNFIGYGPMGDRYLIETSASSIFFYALSSGGIFGFIIILLLGLRSLYLIIYFFFKENNSELINFSILIIIILFLRGVLETSFGIFSIDYCIYITAALLLEQKHSLLKKKFN